MKHLPRILAHAAIILVLMLLTLLILDYINPTMDFINNPLTKGGLIVFCVVSLINAGFVLISTRHR